MQGRGRAFKPKLRGHVQTKLLKVLDVLVQTGQGPPGCLPATGALGKAQAWGGGLGVTGALYVFHQPPPARERQCGVKTSPPGPAPQQTAPRRLPVEIPGPLPSSGVKAPTSGSKTAWPPNHFPPWSLRGASDIAKCRGHSPRPESALGLAGWL